jgi:soluble lytic murein transglycosylase-like protein
MALLESNFNQFEIGSSGEKGIFQIMPEQFSARKIKQSHFDIRVNTELSMSVLRDKFEKHQDYKRAIIAYNGVVVSKGGKWSQKYWNAFSKRREVVSAIAESLK